MPGLFFSKIAGWRPATLLKNSLWRRFCFPVNFPNTSRQLFLYLCITIYLLKAILFVEKSPSRVFCKIVGMQKLFKLTGKHL